MTSDDNHDIGENENDIDNNIDQLQFGNTKTQLSNSNVSVTFVRKLIPTFPSIRELKQYTGVIVCGLTVWATSWFLLKEDVAPGGYLFNMSGIVIAGYIFGHTLERYTTVNSIVGMTLTGALCRNITTTSYLDNGVANQIDFHLRIYPVIILTKGPLSWNWEYIKNNSIKVFTLATVPWIVECLSTALFTHVLLDYPWYWGLHLGSILASVSPAVVVPTVMVLRTRGLGVKNNIALLVGNAGGLDTAFTEGVYGVINSAIFYPASFVYRIIKGTLAIFVGIGFGITWGIFCDLIPDHSDFYAPTIRSILIFAGGLLMSYACGHYGWGGTSGVAIMVCAGTAATRWARRGWPVNDNPVSEVYKLLWRIFEPMLFTLSGYFLDVSMISLQDFYLILACIFGALFFRLLTAFLVSLANELSIKESLFVAVTWMPKAIVEAVLVRSAADSLWSDATEQDKRIAEQHANIIVMAILITTMLGSALTTVLGPLLLSEESKIVPGDVARHKYHNRSQTT